MVTIKFHTQRVYNCNTSFFLEHYQFVNCLTVTASDNTFVIAVNGFTVIYVSDRTNFKCGFERLKVFFVCLILSCLYINFISYRPGSYGIEPVTSSYQGSTLPLS
jgi:hypothetical protein